MTVRYLKIFKAYLVIKIFFISAFLMAFCNIKGQLGRVGVNTETPKTTMEIRSKIGSDGKSLPTDIAGLQAPRLSREELTIKGNNLYGAEQKGALIYISDITGGDNLSQRLQITSVGYYYFDGDYWVKILEEGRKSSISKPVNSENPSLAFCSSLYAEAFGEQLVKQKTSEDVTGLSISHTVPQNVASQTLMFTIVGYATKASRSKDSGIGIFELYQDSIKVASAYMVVQNGNTTPEFPGSAILIKRVTLTSGVYNFNVKFKAIGSDMIVNSNQKFSEDFNEDIEEVLSKLKVEIFTS